mmetsp:Transcript_28366/g.74494  ORF Transcript_28366/g.74494 Transcript_28366/m.74494 type:complete len:266 (-) Transcript_28366:961-1758(-)
MATGSHDDAAGRVLAVARTVVLGATGVGPPVVRQVANLESDSLLIAFGKPLFEHRFPVPAQHRGDSCSDLSLAAPEVAGVPRHDGRQPQDPLFFIQPHVLFELGKRHGDEAKLLLHSLRGEEFDRRARFGAAVEGGVDAVLAAGKHGRQSGVLARERLAQVIRRHLVAAENAILKVIERVNEIPNAVADFVKVRVPLEVGLGNADLHHGMDNGQIVHVDDKGEPLVVGHVRQGDFLDLARRFVKGGPLCIVSHGNVVHLALFCGP